MPATKAEMEAVNRYKRKHLKRIGFEMRIEEYEQVKTMCDSIGEPVNTFIRAAVRDRMSKLQKEQNQLNTIDFSFTEAEQ